MFYKFTVKMRKSNSKPWINWTGTFFVDAEKDIDRIPWSITAVRNHVIEFFSDTHYSAFHFGIFGCAISQKKSRSRITKIVNIVNLDNWYFIEEVKR